MSIVNMVITQEALFDLTFQNQSNIWNLLGIEFLSYKINPVNSHIEAVALVEKQLPENTDRVVLRIEKLFTTATSYDLIYTALPIIDKYPDETLSWQATETFHRVQIKDTVLFGKSR